MHRFTRLPYTADDLRADLADLETNGMTGPTFLRLWEVNNGNAIADWLSGKRPIPGWVRPAFALMFAHPGNIVELRNVASQTIKTDNTRPDRGEFPYANPANSKGIDNGQEHD
jgi:hypothetical protein